MCLIFLLLWFLRVKAPVWEEDEGIVLAFGDASEGGGIQDVSYTDEVTQMEQIPAPALPTRASDNEWIVQEDEESLALSKQTREETKDKANEEVQIRNRKAEQARADSIARAKALAEQKAKEQEAIEKANQMAALFGQAGTLEGANGDVASAGSGMGMGANPVGKEDGKVVVNDKDWNAYVPGRSVKYLPKPSSDFKQDGDVVVRIWVDQAGNVTNAQAIDGSISDLLSYARLYASGLHFTYNPNRLILNKVTDCYLMKNGERVEIEDDKLYCVIADLSSAQMLGSVTDMSYGLLKIIPKFEDGTPVENYEDLIVTRDGKEVKAWVAMANYIDSFADEDGDGIGNVPDEYAEEQGRKVVHDSKAVLNLINHPNKYAMLILGIASLAFVAVVVVVCTIKEVIKKVWKISRTKRA